MPRWLSLVESTKCRKRRLGKAKVAGSNPARGSKMLLFIAGDQERSETATSDVPGSLAMHVRTKGLVLNPYLAVSKTHLKLKTWRLYALGKRWVVRVPEPYL
jgi:hypothetical protein